MNNGYQKILELHGIKSLDDFIPYAKAFFKIKDKHDRLIPFNLNPAQKKAYEVFAHLKSLGIPIRLIVLKARQEGISTLVEAILFHETTTRFNVKAMIVGHVAKASTNLFEMTKRFYDNLPVILKPSVKFNSEKKLVFDVLKSEIHVDTAEGRSDIGRSGTISLLHATEVAFWVDAKASLNALLQSIPKSNRNSIVVLESTANGVGGEFYDAWQDAKAGRSEYVPIFLAWFDLPEYQLSFDSPEMRELFISSMTPEEQDVMKEYSLTYEQMNWRRSTIKNECRGDKLLFMQEYPSNDVEAFITTGRPVFDIDVCRKNYNKYSTFQPVRFELEPEYNKATGKIVGVKRVDNPRGSWVLLEDVVIDPSESYRFAVGCDVAEGLEQGDYSTMSVYDRKQKKFVIKYHAHIEPDLLAVEQLKLQIYLQQKCHFCTEVNNHGLTVVIHANKLRVKQYYRQDYQKGYEVDSMILGFKTTIATKPMVIDRLAENIREQTFIDEDVSFWNEAMTFVKNARGQMSAQGKDKDPATKCFDDRVISEALAFECDSWLPKYYMKIFKNNTYIAKAKVKEVTDF